MHLAEEVVKFLASDAILNRLKEITLPLDVVVKGECDMMINTTSCGCRTWRCRRGEIRWQNTHADMNQLYVAHDVFVFPSLHDSGAQVIGEAMTHGLPVACLDPGRSGVAVDPSWGVVVSTTARSRTLVEQDLATT